MKKIINSGLILLLLTGCGGKEKQENTIKLEEPTIAVGIGKVLPEGGIVELSVNQPSKVIKLHKKLGDDLEEGELILELEAVSEKLKVEQNKAALNSSQQSTKALAYDVEMAEVKLAKLKREYETSKRLLGAKAETAQKVFSDSIAYAEQVATVKRQKQNLLAQQATLQEQHLTVKSSQIVLNDRFFKALQAGTLIRFDVTVGEVLNANNIFGELAPKSELVIEGEMDELFAHKIKTGQKVEVALVGQTEVIATGVLSFVGSSLQNKSILYETIGEGTDRRVRRFTVKLDKGAEQLLINQKVECKIHF